MMPATPRLIVRRASPAMRWVSAVVSASAILRKNWSASAAGMPASIRSCSLKTSGSLSPSRTARMSSCWRIAPGSSSRVTRFGVSVALAADSVSLARLLAVAC